MGIAGDGGILTPPPPCGSWPSGLLSVAELDTRGENGWLKGLEFEQELCVSGGPNVISMQCPPPVEALESLLSQHGFDVEYSDPFVIYSGYDCSTGGSPLSEAWDHAERILDDQWEWALERAFWTGLDQDGNVFRMSLAGGGAVDLTPGGGATDIATGISLLEGYAADFPCGPTIHAPVRVSAFLAEKAQARRIDNKTYTALGTPVALGAGYPLTGPDGVAPGAGEAWMFVSGGIRVTTGPKFFVPDKNDNAAAVDRLVNNITVYAERPVATQIGCSLGAVRVRLAGPS